MQTHSGLLGADATVGSDSCPSLPLYVNKLCLGKREHRVKLYMIPRFLSLLYISLPTLYAEGNNVVYAKFQCKRHQMIVDISTERCCSVVAPPKTLTMKPGGIHVFIVFSRNAKMNRYSVDEWRDQCAVLCCHDGVCVHIS